MVVEVVMSIGSRVPENENAVQVYRTDHKKWLPGKSTCFGRKLAAAASFANGTVMVTGGSRGRKSTEVYKPESNSWSLSDEMQHGRESHALVNFKDKLYSIGGVGKAGKQLNSVELLEDVGRGWTLSKPLKFARDELAAAATSVSPFGKLLCRLSIRRTVVHSIEYFPKVSKTGLQNQGSQLTRIARKT